MTKKKRKHKKPWAVFIAILLAIGFGTWAGKETGIFGVSFYSVVDTLGTVFLNALTLVVVPLVSASIISGISRIGSEEDLGRLGMKMFAFYLGTSLIAILIGLFFVDLIQPGVGQSPPPTSGEEAEQLFQLKQSALDQGGSALVRVLVSIIPSNIVNALSHGEMLGLIFFSLVFGFALTKVGASKASIVQEFFQGLFYTMIEFTHFIMRFLPIGVFCLVAKAFMTSNMESSFKGVFLFFITVILGLLVFMFLALPFLLRFIARVKPAWHFKAMGPALITAFSTSSSSATLPITMDCVEKRSKVSNRICSLVVPLGTSINMSGSALYECVAALFVAQAYGVGLSFTTQFLVVFIALIASIGVAGVPSASLVAILVILKAIGLPPEGIGLFIAVDRLLDMCRTTVNVFSDSCCAVLVAKTEGETEVLATDPDELEWD